MSYRLALMSLQVFSGSFAVLFLLEELSAFRGLSLLDPFLLRSSGKVFTSASLPEILNLRHLYVIERCKVRSNQLYVEVATCISGMLVTEATIWRL